LHHGSAMSTHPSHPQAPPTVSQDARPPWERLVHRWFIEFNPLYLVSAALVLGGCFLLSRGIASGESLWATLGITAVSEVYALSLAGGAALLMRIERRRPAVMLALLFLLYLWDVTLHTETTAYLGAAGTRAAAVWLAVFAVKVRVVAWAMRVRLSKRALAAAMLAAAGLVIGPRVVGDLGARGAGLAIASWAFALCALYERSGAIESLEELGPWARTVLERTTRAAWKISAALLGAHVLFWATSHDVGLRYGVFAAPLVLVRSVRREVAAWSLVAGSLAGAALVMPSALAMTAVIAAAALVLRVVSPGWDEAQAKAPLRQDVPTEPYRWSGGAEPAPASPEPVVTVPATTTFAERVRALTGAATCAYLAAWTCGWHGGAWPAHVMALDALMTVACALAVRTWRVKTPLVPTVAVYVHLAAHVVPGPKTALQWGVTAVALGFALLGGSLGVTYRIAGVAKAARRA